MDADRLDDGPSPVGYLHVVIVLRENKTVDSMLGYLHGKLPALRASESDETYGPSTTPNLARLAQGFGIDDNSFVAGDESETGHATLTGGETTPPTEMFIHVDNDFGYRGNRNGDPLGGIDYPRTRLVREALNAGLSERTYGGDINPGSPTQENNAPWAIWGEQSSSVFSGTNTDYPDTQRAGIFTSGEAVDNAWDTLATASPPPEFGRTGRPLRRPVGILRLPRRVAGGPGQVLRCRMDRHLRRLPGPGGQRCHVSGVDAVAFDPRSARRPYGCGEQRQQPAHVAPQVMVANNDLATGQIAQALSKSPFWRTTLVMIVEDDTQFTADSVNALRSYVVTAGGLARELGPGGQVSHQVSSFCGVDKTVEDLLDLAPKAVCDAMSTPLTSLVANAIPTGALQEYTAVTPGTPPLLPFLQKGSPSLGVWCIHGSPTGIGFAGLLHYQALKCVASAFGAALGAAAPVNHTVAGTAHEHSRLRAQDRRS